MKRDAITTSETGVTKQGSHETGVRVDFLRGNRGQSRLSPPIVRNATLTPVFPAESLRDLRRCQLGDSALPHSDRLGECV